MSIIQAIRKGFQQTWQYKRIVLLLYFLTLLLSGFVAFPFKKLLENTVGHSLMVKDLIKGFDYEFINDFNNAYGAALSPILNQSIAVLVMFMLLMIFFSGGIIAVFIHCPKKTEKNIFWGQAAHYFWRIFRLTIYFLFIHLIILAIFCFIFYTSVDGFSLFELKNDGNIIFALKVIAPIYIFVGTLFFMLQDYCKIFLVKSDKPWIYQSVFPSFKFIIKNFTKVIGLYFLNLILWSTVLYINYLISSFITFNSLSGIILSFLFSQLFVITRFFLKLINLSSINEMHNQTSK
ncbi:hypothetical protein OAK19_04355 [Aureispira]|nr:hypothetical protein [Aureispira sp.]